MRFQVPFQIFLASFLTGILQSVPYVLLLNYMTWWAAFLIVVMLTLIGTVIAIVFSGTTIFAIPLALFLPGIWPGVFANEKKVWRNEPDYLGWLLALPIFFIGVVIAASHRHDTWAIFELAFAGQIAVLGFALLYRMFSKPRAMLSR